MGLRALVVGAHPDDIEIAAGGTMARLAGRGADILAVVATDETDAAIASTRRSETRAGLEALGVDRTALRFLGLPDRSVHPDDGSLRLRRLLEELEFVPDVVITHSCCDDHSDHRGVSVMVEAVCRARSPILFMGVVNSIQECFRPTFFVDTTQHLADKVSALDAHRSQDALGRIRRTEIDAMERANASMVSGTIAEGFELVDDHLLFNDEIARWFAPCWPVATDHLRIGSTLRSDTWSHRTHT